MDHHHHHGKHHNSHHHPEVIIVDHQHHDPHHHPEVLHVGHQHHDPHHHPEVLHVDHRHHDPHHHPEVLIVDQHNHETHHHPDHHPHVMGVPIVINHHSHEGGSAAGLSATRPSFRLFCKAETNCSLTIRDGQVVLARTNPHDTFQHWIIDVKYSMVKDEEGFPSFALVNKATGQAIKHSIGASHPVQLRHYNSNELDESLLWSESKDLGDGYKAIRMVNNIRLNLDAFRGDKNHGALHDGTVVGLWEWKKGDNQRWRIATF